jgi:NitT/TauT family transport system substrate-binding protein
MRLPTIAFVFSALALLASCAAPGARAPGASGYSAAPAPAAVAPDAGSPTRPLRSLKMAYGFVSTADIPMWIAEDQGIFTKYGLDVDTTLLQTSAQIAPAMAAGEVDVALTAGAGVVDIDLAGGDQVLIEAEQNMMRFFLQAQPEIHRVEDLRGKRVAITRLGSGVHLAAIKVLEQAGLEPGRDTALIQAGTVNNALSALASGQVEAAMLSAPTNILAERQGFPLLVDVKDLQIPYSQGALAATRTTLEERYDLVRDFVKAMLEARGVAMRDPALAKRLLGQNTKTEDQDILDRSYQLWLEDLDELPYASVDAVQTVLDQRAPEVQAVRTANPYDFVDDRIVRELEASGFLRSALSPAGR